MKIVIELSDETYKDIKEENSIYGINNDLCARITGKVVGAIQSGTPLPKGHGDLIDRKLALSDDGLCEFHLYDDYVKMRNYLKSIPLIIEADKKESEV